MNSVAEDVCRQVERLLYLEARLLDSRRFEEWLDLWTEDAIYWMPGRKNSLHDTNQAESVNKAGELALFEDTKATLTTRIARFRTGMAWSEEPASRTRHLITNIEVFAGPSDGELTVHSNFLVYRAQLELDKDTFVGGREDVLRAVDDGWKIAKRTLLMEDVVLTSGPLSIFF